MNDDAFELLNSLAKDGEDKVKKPVECEHRNVITERIQDRVCVDCGQILSKNFTYEREWRYYGTTDTKHMNDPNRCSLRKQDEKGIFKDLEKYKINKKIVFTANDIYNHVTQQKIFRGNTRRGIIFACVYHAYNLNQLPQSCKNLIQIFDIEQKIALKGLKFVNLNLPLDSDLRQLNTSNNVEHLIREIMTEFHASKSQVDEVLRLYQHIQDKSSLLNRSRPQSVACGLIRYYILKKNPEYSIDYFREKIKLSDLTLSRIVKEIETILA